MKESVIRLALVTVLQSLRVAESAVGTVLELVGEGPAAPAIPVPAVRCAACGATDVEEITTGAGVTLFCHACDRKDGGE